MIDKFELESVRHYISLLQDNINRMACNSSNCKTWLVGVITAVFALQVSDTFSLHFITAIAVTVLFYFLDSYYLGEEKRFRDVEKSFVDKVKSGEDYEEELYAFRSSITSQYAYLWRGMMSSSTWTFYGVIIIVILAVSAFI